MTLRDSRQHPLTRPLRHRGTRKGSHTDMQSHLPGNGPPRLAMPTNAHANPEESGELLRGVPLPGPFTSTSRGLGVGKHRLHSLPSPHHEEGQAPPPQRCAGGKHRHPGLLSLSVQLEETVRPSPGRPPAPALQEHRTGTKRTRKARLPGGWKWKPVVRH